MKFNPIRQLEKFRIELTATVTFLAVLGIVYLPNVLTVFGTELEVTTHSPGKYGIITNSALNSGNYFLSLGRPKGSCQITDNGKKIADNKSPASQTRDLLGLGVSLKVTEPKKVNLEIDCFSEAGFKPQLAYTPALFNEGFGKFVQSVRLLFQTVLSPTASGMLLLVLAVLLVLNKQKNGSNLTAGPSLFLFSLVCFAYSLSLSHVTRLFFEPGTATIFHVLLRTALILSFIILAGDVSRKRFISIYIIGLFLVVLTLRINNVEYLVATYKSGYILYIFATLEVYVRNRKSIESDSKTRVVTILAFTWSITQSIDSVFSFGFQSGENLSLAIALVIPAYISNILIIKFMEFNEAVQLTNVITSLLSEDGKIDQRVNSFGMWLKRYLNATHSSFYVDKFLLGIENSPGLHFRGILTDRHLPSRDFSLESSAITETNNWSAEALKTQRSLLGCNIFDRKLFACIPVGGNLLFNFSFDDASESSLLLLQEKFRFLQSNNRLLQSFAQVTSSHNSLHYATLRSLRSKLGDCELQGKVLIIFIDVNGYTKLIKNYGPTFSNFIESKIMEKVAHDLRSVATVELKMGDEMHLAVLPWILQSGDIEEASIECLAYLYNFFKNELPGFCLDNGFDPFTVSIGVAYGETTLRINDRHAGTSGPAVNLAKRLLQGAEAAEIIISDSVLDLIGDSFPEKFAARQVFIKNDLCNAHSVRYSLDENAVTRVIESF